MSFPALLPWTVLWTPAESKHYLSSIWTVDLAHLLRVFGLRILFTTLTLGTNPGFSTESFYGQMEQDELRVKRLFLVPLS